MCLSTVYKGSRDPQAVVMKNVQKITFQDGVILLTDLMERTCAVEGRLVEANLVDGYVILEEAVPA